MPSCLFYRVCLIILQVTKLKKNMKKIISNPVPDTTAGTKIEIKTILSLRPVKVLHKLRPFCFWTNGSDEIQQKLLAWIMQYK